jgi:hypothetical protein
MAVLNYIAQPSALLQLFITEESKVIAKVLRDRKIDWIELEMTKTRVNVSELDNELRFLTIDRDIATYEMRTPEVPNGKWLMELFLKNQLSEELWQRFYAHRALFPADPDALVRACLDMESAGSSADSSTNEPQTPSESTRALWEEVPFRMRFTDIKRRSEWTHTFIVNLLRLIAKEHNLPEDRFVVALANVDALNTKKLFGMSRKSLQLVLGDEKLGKLLYRELGSFTYRRFLRSWQFWLLALAVTILVPITALTLYGLQQVGESRGDAAEEGRCALWFLSLLFISKNTFFQYSWTSWRKNRNGVAVVQEFRECQECHLSVVNREMLITRKTNKVVPHSFSQSVSRSCALYQSFIASSVVLVVEEVVLVLNAAFSSSSKAFCS